MATFIDRAAACVQRGLNYIPLHQETKVAVEVNWQDRTYSTMEEAERLNAQNANYNIAVVFKNVPGGVWSLDTDGPTLYRMYKEQTGKSIPDTLTIQSRDHQHGNRIYRNTAASIAMGNIDFDDEHGEVFSARCHNRYQVFVGSIHPDTKAIYTIIHDVPIVEAPDDFVLWLQTLKTVDKPKEERSETWMDDPIPDGKRNKTLFAIGSALRRIGMDYDATYAVLSHKNQVQCQPPLPDEDIQTISNSAVRYSPEKTTLTIGGRPLDGVDSFKPTDDTPEVPVAVSWQDRFKSVKQLESGEVRMLINGFLPEGMIFIGALPGEGKTLLGLSISKALTTGAPFLGHDKFTVPSIVPVLYMIPESGARAFRKRCEKFHIPDDRNLFICRTISEGVTLSLDNPSLLQAITELRPVVILDTVIRFSDAADENAAAQNKKLAEDIIRLRQAGAVAVIGIHHSVKKMRESGMTLETVLRGTGDLAAMADAVYGMLRDDKLYDNGTGVNEISVTCVKPRDFDPPAPFRVAATEKTGDSKIGTSTGIRSVIDAYGDLRFIDNVKATMDRDERILKFIIDNPRATLSELAEVTGMTPWAIRSATKRLGYEKNRGGKSGASTWAKKGEGLSSKAQADPANEARNRAVIQNSLKDPNAVRLQ